MRAALSRWVTALYASPALLLTLTTLFWAGNTVAGRLAVDQITPMTIVVVRWILVVAVLWAIYGREIIASRDEIRGRYGWMLAMALFGFTLFNTLFYIAAHSTGAINLGIIQGSMPVFVLLGAWASYGTRITAAQGIGVLLTLLGVAYMATQGRPWEILGLKVSIGDLEMLLACILYAWYTVKLRERPKLGGAALFTILAGFAAVTSLPLLVVEAAMQGLHWPTLTGWAVALYVAIFPSCLAQLFFMRGVDLIGPGRAGVYINLVPVFSAILAVLVISEPFAVFHAVALVMVIGGIWLAQRAAAK